MTEKVVGVLGGMGPEATVDFFAKIIALTPAEKDQDHLRIIIDNNPKIPDRTEAILKNDPSLLPALVETARNLERAGVDFIVIPCNTAHYLYEELIKAVSVPVLHIVREVVSAVKVSLPRCRRVGLLATSGTVISNLYQEEFQGAGVEVVVPAPEHQTKVMNAILTIKSGHERDRAKQELIEIGNWLIRECGAQAIVLGCTDISTVIGADCFEVPVFDSNLVLARATVRYAKNLEGGER